MTRQSSVSGASPWFFPLLFPPSPLPALRRRSGQAPQPGAGLRPDWLLAERRGRRRSRRRGGLPRQGRARRRALASHSAAWRGRWRGRALPRAPSCAVRSRRLPLSPPFPERRWRRESALPRGPGGTGLCRGPAGRARGRKSSGGWLLRRRGTGSRCGPWGRRRLP